MRVRLIKKLAPHVDGVDLSHHEVGTVLDLPSTQARLLIAEGWAVRERRHKAVTPRVIAFRRSTDPGHRDDDIYSRAS
jgi:hypothetical protein